MKKSVSILLMTLNDNTSESIINSFGDLQITFLKSKPSYANYLKTLQYLPEAIVMEMPRTFHDQLHFVQMVKQNSMAGDIPIICFGDRVDVNIEQGMKKIGIDEYFKRPFDMRLLASAAIDRMKKKGVMLRKRSLNPEKEKEIDVARILSAHVSRQEKIELMIKHISDVMAFPFTISMALRLLGSENSGANDLAKIIETDPTISANFLRKANSVYFSGKNTRTVTMKDAIVRIGFTETRRIITGMAVMQIFDASRYNPGFNRVEFWFHCLATAKIAEHLARLSNAASPDEAFLAGIMHDFGIILLDEFYPDLFARILQISTDFGKRFYEVEEDILSITHNDFVRPLFEQWKIPDSITYAVVNHQTILQSASGSPSNMEVMAIIISIANMLAKTFRLGASCDQFVFPVENRYLSILHATIGLPEDFNQQIVNQLGAYKELLKIEEEPVEKRYQQSITGAPRFNIGIADFTGAAFNPIEQYLRLCGHTIISIVVPANSYDAYRCKCDIVLVFTDSATRPDLIEPLGRIERKTEAHGAEYAAGGAVPLIVFINKEKPCTAAVNIPGISLLPAAIDLRMLDVHIDSVVHGRSVKSLPWESIIKPPRPAETEIDNPARELQAAYRTLRHFKERCAELRIVSEDHRVAESYIEKARIYEKENDRATAHVLISLAAEYYRKSYFTFELGRCEKNIAGLKSALKGEA